MFRLYDGRDKDFEIVTDNLQEIKDYLGEEYADCENVYDLSEKLESENDGMDFYHVKEI